MDLFLSQVKIRKNGILCVTTTLNLAIYEKYAGTSMGSQLTLTNKTIETAFIKPKQKEKTQEKGND